MLGFAWKFCLALDSPRASTKKNEIQNVESRIPHQVPIESRANSIHTCPQGYLYNLDPPGQYSLASSLLVMELWNFIKKWLCWDLKPLDFVEGISTWMSKVWEHCQHDCKWCPFGSLQLWQALPALRSLPECPASKFIEVHPLAKHWKLKAPWWRCLPRAWHRQRGCVCCRS